MASSYEVNIEDVEPMSRTYQYRKVMKPMLERKRRARINKCLDELKDLMVGALQSEGETITKLEKADVLELTVRHLRKLKQHHALALPSPQQSHEKFRSGFTHCANEVSRFVSGCPGVDIHVSARLLSHLGGCISQLDKMGNPVAPLTPPTPTALKNAVTVPISITVPRAVYNTPPASPEAPSQVSPQPTSVSPAPSHATAPVVVLAHRGQRVPIPANEPVWRPW
ncbi:unnamed protein product, partial [Meganyctiphanes norvegica]